MEPLARTRIVIARNHLAKTDFIAVAVTRFAVFVFVVAFMHGFLLDGWRTHGHGDVAAVRLLRWPLRRGRVRAARRS